MDIRRWNRSLAAAALAATMLLVAASAFAQPKPALVQDRDEPGRNPYQQAAVNPACIGFFTCSLDFAAVPAGMRLVVTQVTIETAVSDASGAVAVRVLNNTLAARAAFVVTGPFNTRFATVPVVMYVEAGQVLNVQTVATGGVYSEWVVATLVGYFVPL